MTLKECCTPKAPSPMDATAKPYCINSGAPLAATAGASASKPMMAGGGAAGATSAVSRAMPASSAVVPAKTFPTPMLPASSIIPSGYGFVVLTAIGSVSLLTWKAIKVGRARADHKIPYPVMYSLDNVAFNCIQRAHQNTLENYPQFLTMLLIGGLEMPYFCTLGGIIWLSGRYAYARGYYTGDPRKRARGTFGIFGMIMLGIATTRFGLRHLW